MLLRISMLVVMVLGAGCMIGEVDEPQVGAVQQDIQLCDGWLCGTNSPQIAEFGFWELNLPPAPGTAGLPNNVGMQVLGFVQGSYLYLPSVSRGRLFATRTSTVAPFDTITISGNGLVGGWFYLRNNGRLFKLRVAEVGSVASWAQPTDGGHVVLESYKLDWSEFVNSGWGDPRSLCPNPPGREGPDALTMTGQLAYHTLLFEGDRIDAIKKLDTAVDTSWFNLGCAGSALAKMALTGHTEASLNAHTFVTTLPERQTMLKMLAADYCGDGTPFTVPGQPLNWADDHGTMKIAALIPQPPLPVLLEARWKESGAVCLDKPRTDAHPTTLSLQTFGIDVYDQVKSYCPSKLPPQCADSSFGLGGYHLVSATPL
jgi:hypothetical protein